MARQELAPKAPVHQSLAPRQHKSQPQLLNEQIASYEAPKSIIDKAQPEHVNPSDTIYQDSFEEPMMNPDEAYHSYLKSLEQDKNQSAPEVSKPAQPTVDRMHRHLPAPPLASEPEEYWEEDEEEEIYDEQGYTTAHSYRSRGENTTGGATTVLFPKVTNKAKKELAEAKAIVESARTPEEIEDEAWDTSMVAEYGDEIFAYMRELEVSLPFLEVLLFTILGRVPCGHVCGHSPGRSCNRWFLHIPALFTSQSISNKYLWLDQNVA